MLQINGTCLSNERIMNEHTENAGGGSQPQVSIGGGLDEAFKLILCSVVHDRGLPRVGWGTGVCDAPTPGRTLRRTHFCGTIMSPLH